MTTQRKVLDGTVNDHAFLPIIYGADETDDWTSSKTWKKANPNYDISIKADYLAAECEKAKVTPAYENTFKRLHLNIWTQQETRWLQMSIWDRCAELPFNAQSLLGKRCYAGIDLSDSGDMTACVLVFPPAYIPLKLEPEINGDNIERIDIEQADQEPFYILPFFWIPEEKLAERVRRDHVPYDVWLKQGFVTATPGDTIDHRYVAMTLGKARLDYDLRGAFFDPWGPRKITADLIEEYGFTGDVEEGKRYQKPWLVLCPQTYQFWTPPLNDLVSFLTANKIAHGNNPVLRWNASNAVVEEGRFGGRRLIKKRSREKIDGLVAMVMGFEAAVRNAKNETDTQFVWSA